MMKMEIRIAREMSCSSLEEEERRFDFGEPTPTKEREKHKFEVHSPADKYSSLPTLKHPH